jgi:hypothetical protein
MRAWALKLTATRLPALSLGRFEYLHGTLAGRFGRGGGETLFDRICRENGITHRLTKPRSPTTTGKVERFHQTLQRELLDDHGPFESLAHAQAAIDAFRHEYNTDRPHQSLGMDFPADHFALSPPDEIRRRLPPRLRDNNPATSEPTSAPETTAPVEPDEAPSPATIPAPRRPAP